MRIKRGSIYGPYNELPMNPIHVGLASINAALVCAFVAFLLTAHQDFDALIWRRSGFFSYLFYTVTRGSEFWKARFAHIVGAGVFGFFGHYAFWAWWQRKR